MEKQRKQLYIELLRIISIFSVIIIHVTAVYLSKYSITSIEWTLSKVINDCCRFSVPLFFMISGACFLNSDRILDIKTMLSKYVFKLLKIILFYGVFYYFIDVLIYNQQISLKHFLALPFNLLSANTGYHLWFLYDLVIIYCFVPILQKLVVSLSKKEYSYLVCLIIIFNFGVNYINDFSQNVISSASLLFLNFDLMSSLTYFSCFILGGYLAKYNLKKKMLQCISVLAIIILFCSIAINVYMSGIMETNFSFLCTSDSFPSIAVASVLFCYFKDKEEKLYKKNDLILYLGKKVLHIYLLHVLINYIVFMFIELKLKSFFVLAEILLISIFVFLTSLLINNIIKNIKILLERGIKWKIK